MKSPLTTKGFGLLGVLVIVLAIAIASFSAWFIWNKNQDTKKITDSSNTNSSNKNNNTTTDPYEGWKTYCDASSKYCFKYPATWTADTTSPGQVNLTSGEQDVEVDYSNPYVHDSGLLAFDAVSIDDVTVGDTKFKIVGGVYDDATEPRYAVVDASLLTNYPLTIGALSQFPNALRFTDIADSSSHISFRVMPSSVKTSLNQAKDWFDTDAAKTSLLVLKSLSYKNE